MACDGTRVFVLGGTLSPGTEVAKAELILVLDTSMYFLFVILFGKPSSLKQSSLFTRDPTPTLSTLLRRTIQHVRNSLASVPTGPTCQSQHPGRIFPSSDAGVTHGAFPSEIATSEDMRRPASPQITRERNPSPSCLPSQLTGVDDKPRCVLREDDFGESLMERHSRPMAPGASSEKQVARLEHGRIVDLKRQLSETLAA